MSRLVDVLNRIREQIREEWLTPSQQQAAALIGERLSFLDEVNLWGVHGAGKTFLGWVLARHEGKIYVPGLDSDARPGHLLIVDNLGWRRDQVRAAIHAARGMGFGKVVLITDAPVDDQLPTVELRLEPADLQAAAANLMTIGIEPRSDAPRSLWDLVCPIEL